MSDKGIKETPKITAEDIIQGSINKAKMGEEVILPPIADTESARALKGILSESKPKEPINFVVGEEGKYVPTGEVKWASEEHAIERKQLEIDLRNASKVETYRNKGRSIGEEMGKRCAGWVFTEEGQQQSKELMDSLADVYHQESRIMGIPIVTQNATRERVERVVSQVGTTYGFSGGDGKKIEHGLIKINEDTKPIIQKIHEINAAQIVMNNEHMGVDFAVNRVGIVKPDMEVRSHDEDPLQHGEGMDAYREGFKTGWISGKPQSK